MGIGQKPVDEGSDPSILNRVKESRSAAFTTSSATRRFDRIRIARLVSLVLHPFLVSPLSIVLVLYLDSGAFWSALGWAVLCAAFVVGPALVFLYWKLKHKHFSDADVSVSHQRHGFYIFGGACMIVCFAILLWLNAPPLLITSFLAALAAVIVSAVVTRFWTKVSIHSCAMTGVTTMVAFYSVPIALLLTIGTLLVIWSRLILKRHTLSEAILGGVIAVSCTLLIFTPGILQ